MGLTAVNRRVRLKVYPPLTCTVFDPMVQPVNEMVKDNWLPDNLSNDLRHKAIKFVLTFEKGKTILWRQLKRDMVHHEPWGTSRFICSLKKVDKAACRLNLSPIYGLENAYGYGRSLAVWPIEKGYMVKDVNPSLAYDQRKSAPMMKKNDEHDAYCVATVLINQLHTLPDAKPEDNHWTLSQLVNRRDTLVKDGIRLKNGLHEQLTNAYPSYRKFFCEIDRKTALYFWKTYLSPGHLKNKSAEEL